jgi:tetratricopeptide (TPR) repeat protein
MGFPFVNALFYQDVNKYRIARVDAGYVYNMGLAACRASRTDDCRDAIKKASIMDPALGSVANFNLGSLLAARGMYKEADEAFQTSIAFDPNNPETQFQVALLLVREQATIANAIPYLEKYLALAPTGSHAGEARQMLETIRPATR